jgi:transcriptional regulator with XRE-family HTH domain
MQHLTRIRTYSVVLPVPRLHFWRTKRALSQRELGKLSGLSRTTIVKLEGGRDAWPQTVRKLAKALRVDPEDLQEPT